MNQEHQINMVREPECVTEVYKVRLDSKIQIKANSENLVKMKIDGFKPGDKILFEPSQLTVKDLSRGVVWASSLNEVRSDNTIYLSVMNATNKETFVDKETLVGNLF